MRTFLLYFVTAIAEMVGCYFQWLWLRQAGCGEPGRGRLAAHPARRCIGPRVCCLWRRKYGRRNLLVAAGGWRTSFGVGHSGCRCGARSHTGDIAFQPCWIPQRRPGSHPSKAGFIFRAGADGHHHVCPAHAHPREPPPEAGAVTARSRYRSARCPAPACTVRASP